MIQIVFDPTDMTRYLRALYKLGVKVQIWQNTICYRGATDYFQLVHKNIMSEKYSGAYPAYSEKYGKWKQKKGYKYPGWWKLEQNLLNALTVFKTEDGWMGGIPAGLGGSRGGTIAVYGSAGEFESFRGDQPARPVFEPTMQEYAKDENGWKKRAKEALDAMKEAWA